MSSPLARTGQRARRAAALCSVFVVAVVAAAGSTAAASGSPSKHAAAETTTTGASTKVKKVTVKAPGVTATEIHVGSITSKTNPIGGLNGLLDEGIKAYFNVVNSKGGVWGRKLKLTSQRDDQTANNLTQTEAMLSQDNVYAVFEAAELFSGAKKLEAAGIPTFGWNINAEWAGPKNFFPNHAPICFGKTCSSLGRSLPWIVKQNHRHKVAFLAYSVPQSADSAVSGAATIKKFSKQIDADVVYQDTSLAFGQLDFSAQVAQMKEKGVDFLMTSMDGNGDYAVAKEMQNQGILDKVTFFHPNLYDQDFVKKNADVLEGGIVLVAILAAEQKPAPPALKQYLVYAKKHDLKVTEMTLQGWMAARQMVDALKATGPNFTWANLVKTWNKQTYYTNGGLNAPMDWTYQHNDPTESVANRSPFECYNFVKIHNGKFVGIYNGGGSKPWLCFNGKKPDEWQTPANVSFAGKPVDITALVKPAAATGSTTTG